MIAESMLPASAVITMASSRPDFFVGRTVRVNLAGGLGNQMFMYAAGRALAERSNARLLLNTTAFSRDRVYKRRFLLNRFPITATVLRDTWSSRTLDLLDFLAGACPGLLPGFKVIHESKSNGVHSFSADLARGAAARSVSLRGYWQDERYFRDIAGIIRRELAPPAAAHDPTTAQYLHQIDQSAHPVAVAIRFYREMPGPTADPREIIGAFRRVVSDHARRRPGCDYFVFSEEPGYFDEPHSVGVRATIVDHDGRNEIAPAHLHLMSRCHTFFIGYSSYHWWGAWLGDRPDKSVTYLRFPDRRGAEYAAAGWNVVEVN